MGDPPRKIRSQTKRVFFLLSMCGLLFGSKLERPQLNPASVLRVSEWMIGASEFCVDSLGNLAAHFDTAVSLMAPEWPLLPAAYSDALP